MLDVGEHSLPVHISKHFSGALDPAISSLGIYLVKNNWLLSTKTHAKGHSLHWELQ
jgi:hypothetical protein